MQAIDRRELMRKAGITAGAAGALWATPVVSRFMSPAAAVSGTSGSVDLRKAADNASTVTTAGLCGVGSTASAGRGTVVFTRTESPSLLSVTITLSTGTSIQGNSLYVLQSDSSGCLGGTTTPVGTWTAGSGNNVSQTFSNIPILANTTGFVLFIGTSGGQGNQQYATSLVTLP